MTRLLGVGDFVAWDGGCMLIGRAHAATGIHSHYAMQLSFGENDGICFRPDDQSTWTAYEGTVISSRQPHAMDATTVTTSATLLIEQETPAGRALEKRFGSTGISPVSRAELSDAAASLFAAWRQHKSGEATADAARRVLSGIASTRDASTAYDERILRAITYINQNLGGPLTLDAVAKEAFLSPTRFRHLFVEQTGTALRPYVLWRRFLRAWSLIRDGASLSAAAHEAGFADAAHLTRTSQKMFGFAPSALLVNQRSA
jgi:AraC family transcriptional regulator